jgi:hypothetical protein
MLAMSLKEITMEVTGISDFAELLPFILYLAAGQKAKQYAILGFFF